MKKSISISFTVLIFILFPNAFCIAQSGSSWFSWPEGLGFSNHLEYSYNTDTDGEILENWLNLDYSKGIFSSGLRLEVFQPNDPDPSISRGKTRFAEIDFIYFKADIVSDNEGIDIVAGKF
jgi:hypothetical protein